MQNTLEDLTSRVDKVKEENLKLKSENTVLGQYIENLMQVLYKGNFCVKKIARSSFLSW